MALNGDTGLYGTGNTNQLNQVQDLFSQYGVKIEGGSTVVPSQNFMIGGKPGPTSKVYLGYNFDRSLYTGGSGPTKGKVYDPDLGSFRQTTSSGGSQGPYAPGVSGSDSQSSVDYNTAIGVPMTWSEAEKRDFISKGILYKVPGFSADMGMPEVMDAWKSLVDSSVEFSQNSKQKWSPQDVMNSYANDDKNFGTVKSKDGDWLLDAATGERIKYIGPKTKTTTDKRIDLSSAEDVKAITTQMLTELLGRAPTAEELAKYRSSINGYESDNPAITTTVSHINDRGEVSAQDTTTAGGTSDAARQSLISDQVTGTQEFGKYQSGTTYFNALLQMLGG